MHALIERPRTGSGSAPSSGAVDVAVLLGSALAQLESYAAAAAKLVDERHSVGPGFLSVEAKKLQAEQRANERRLVARQHADQRARWLHPTTTLKAQAPSPAPLNVTAVSVVDEIDHFLWSIADDLHLRLEDRGGVCLLDDPIRDGHYGPTSATDAALRRNVLRRFSADVLAIYRDTRYLRRVHAQAEDLVTRARRFVDGVQTMAHPDPCPWCDRHTLVTYLSEGVIRCEADPDEGRRLPCICSDTYCGCRTSGKRHEWHRSDRDVRKAIRDTGGDPTDPAHAMQIPNREPRARRPSETWYGLQAEQARRGREKQEHDMSVAAIARVRDLHQPTPVQPYVDACPADQHDADQAHQWVEHRGYEICLTCPPVLVACVHCSHDGDDAYTEHPCATVRALDGTDQ